MATCLSEERCTAFNYAPAKERRGCERRHCAHGEQPTLLRHGWVGYSKYSSRDAKLKHPEDITMLPSILTAALLLLVAITSVLVALQRACPDRVDDLLARLTKRPRSDSPPPMHHSSRGHVSAQEDGVGRGRVLESRPYRPSDVQLAAFFEFKGLDSCTGT
jgi:hypothetical protein